MILIGPAKCTAQYNLLLQECNAIYHDAASAAGISDCAFRILYMLEDTDGTRRQNEIAQAASMPPQTVNSALKKLEKDGLVLLTGSRGKAGKKIELTPSGRQFIQKHILPVKQAEDEVAASFSESEIETFMRLLEAVVKRLGAAVGAAVRKE